MRIACVVLTMTIPSLPYRKKITKSQHQLSIHTNDRRFRVLKCLGDMWGRTCRPYKLLSSSFVATYLTPATWKPSVHTLESVFGFLSSSAMDLASAADNYFHCISDIPDSFRRICVCGFVDFVDLYKIDRRTSNPGVAAHLLSPAAL